MLGGGDSAVGEAVYLTKFARKVTLVHRRDSLRASKILQDRFLNSKRGKIRWDSIATEILGTDRVTGVKIKNRKTDKEEEIPAGGVFIYVGIEPNTGFLKDTLKLDDEGFIITDENMQTSVKGLFACGDVRKNILKQVVTACGEGAQAGRSCLQYIEELKLKG